VIEVSISGGAGKGVVPDFLCIRPISRSRSARLACIRTWSRSPAHPPDVSARATVRAQLAQTVGTVPEEWTPPTVHGTVATDAVFSTCGLGL
jgi:hypothetical protein